MKALRSLLHAVFPPSDPNWRWRRRMAFSGCLVALWSVIDAAKFQADHQWAAVELAAGWGAFATTLGTYLGIGAFDDHSKRKNPPQEQTT